MLRAPFILRHGEAMADLVQLPYPVVIPVSGVSFRQDVVRSLVDGQKLILQRDRDNEYDRNAIAVFTLDGRQVGFVPAKVIGRFTDQPYERWGGRVIELLGEETRGVRVRVTHANVEAPGSPPDSPSYTVPQPPNPTEAPGEEPGVYARSGRYLGQLVEGAPSPKVVMVKTTEGTVRRYPAGLVVVNQAS